MAVNWKLPNGIIELSEASNWDRAVKEWSLDYIEKLDPGEDSETCLCGHTPIRELCHIINTRNQKRAIVGNHCIEKFNRYGTGQGVFENAPKIFSASNKILKDFSANPNEALINYALDRDVITPKDSKFYEDIARKRKLTTKQQDYKKSLNQKILYSVVLSAKAAFERLKRNENTTAGPKLIEFAFKKEVLTQANYDFYMKIWDRGNEGLSQNQANYKLSLNRKIISQLNSDDFSIARDSQRDLESFERDEVNQLDANLEANSRENNENENRTNEDYYSEIALKIPNIFDFSGDEEILSLTSHNNKGLKKRKSIDSSDDVEVIDLTSDNEKELKKRKSIESEEEPSNKYSIKIEKEIEQSEDESSGVESKKTSDIRTFFAKRKS